jgi:hypothetical protein
MSTFTASPELGASSAFAVRSRRLAPVEVRIPEHTERPESPDEGSRYDTAVVRAMARVSTARQTIVGIEKLADELQA